MDAERLKALLEITRLLAAEISLDSLLELILENGRLIVNADRSTLFLVDQANQTLTSYRALGVEGQAITVPIGRGLAGHVAATGEVINLPDAYEDPRFDQSVDRATGYRTHTLLTVPMVDRKGTISGVLQALNKQAGQFTAEDEELLLSLASSASVALEKARLYATLRERERLNRDLEIARAIQLSLLPTRLPLMSHIEFAASCQPALAVGGDFYDFSTLDNGNTLVIVADVSGKGVSAGLIMGMVRTAVRAETYRTQSLSDILASCNRALFDDLNKTNMFATAFAAAIDASGETLAYANAGHCKAILYRAATQEVELLDTDGMPMGILPDTAYEHLQVALQPGDTVVLYSDGMTDAVGPGKPIRRYSLDQFIQSVRQHGHLPAEPLRQALSDDVTRFSGDMPQADDQTVAIIKVRPQA